MVQVHLQIPRIDVLYMTVIGEIFYPDPVQSHIVFHYDEGHDLMQARARPPSVGLGRTPEKKKTPPTGTS